ncbi:hypothetical protein F5Y16DRAFT_403180 [Xylariaceae sp. FL0255]|nr:hypothetical protein F5Y16DRAFT_403180 [Xylariaceae sp. FL0255]
MQHSPAYGRRLMPAVLDDLAKSSPNGVYAVPNADDVKHGFKDVTVADVARMVSYLAWCIEARFGKGQNFEPIAYIGIAVIPGPIVFQALVECGSKKLDFSLAVKSFHPFLHAIVEVICLSIETKRCSRILFVSSLSSVGNLATVSLAPEALVEDMSAAADFGYAQSKLATERILAVAVRRWGIPVSVVRICQLVGSEPGFAVSDQSWLSAVVTTAKTLNCIPTNVAIVDWIRSDVAAGMLYDIFKAPIPRVGEGGAAFYNISHPRPAKWEKMVDVLRERLNGAKVVLLHEWIARLRDIRNPTAEDIESLPALMTLDFFTWLSNGAENSRYATDHAARTLTVELPAIDKHFIEYWLGE